jgi:hypothetical protein
MQLKMRYKNIILCIIICVSKPMFSQDNVQKNNTFYVELFGNSKTIFSLNIERKLNFYQNHNKFPLFLRAGYSAKSNEFDNIGIDIVPIEIIFLKGNKYNYIEFAFGLTSNFGHSDLSNPKIPIEYKSNYSYCFTFRPGYRLVFDSNSVLRLAPLITVSKISPLSSQWQVGLTFGLTYGVTFNVKKKKP